MEFTLEVARVIDEPISVISDKWQDKAACKGADPEIFFLPFTQSKALDHCAYCPVIVECLEWANSEDAEGLVMAPHGIYGGATPEQRRAIRKRNALPQTRQILLSGWKEVHP